MSNDDERQARISAIRSDLARPWQEVERAVETARWLLAELDAATARAERAETFLPTLLTKWIGREDPPGLERFWCRECGYHWWKNAPEDHATACIVGKVRAALAEGA